MDQWHRHMGVYGFCFNANKVLVIKKNGGPYTARFDLPGGRMESNESMLEALHREFYEETGLKIKVIRNVGVRDYVLPWARGGLDQTHIHHIAVFYEVDYLEGDIEQSPTIEDSLGAEWVETKLLNIDNASPLVMDAVQWYERRKVNIETEVFDSWIVKSEGEE